MHKNFLLKIIFWIDPNIIHFIDCLYVYKISYNNLQNMIVTLQLGWRWITHKTFSPKIDLIEHFPDIRRRQAYNILGNSRSVLRRKLRPRGGPYNLSHVYYPYLGYSLWYNKSLRENVKSLWFFPTAVTFLSTSTYMLIILHLSTHFRCLLR